MVNTVIAAVIPDKKSNVAMIFLRFARSARIPPNGDSRIVGINAKANSPAKIDAEPVNPKIYTDKANLRIVFANKELICPKKKLPFQAIFLSPHLIPVCRFIPGLLKEYETHP